MNLAQLWQQSQARRTRGNGKKTAKARADYVGRTAFFRDSRQMEDVTASQLQLVTAKAKPEEKWEAMKRVLDSVTSGDRSLSGYTPQLAAVCLVVLFVCVYSFVVLGSLSAC